MERKFQLSSFRTSAPTTPVLHISAGSNLRVEYLEREEQTEVASYVVASATEVPFREPQVFIFLANGKGDSSTRARQAGGREPSTSSG